VACLPERAEALRILPQATQHSVGIAFTRRLIADNVLGTVLLRIVYWLEEAFPHALVRVGTYPVVLIQKTSG
jgi:hypothetical protein